MGFLSCNANKGESGLGVQPEALRIGISEFGSPSKGLGVAWGGGC